MTKENILPIQKPFPNSSSLAFGCMGISRWDDAPISDQDRKEAETAVDLALENNINFFDHADIYTFTKAETIFGEILNKRPSMRDQIILQSKCGIRFEDDTGPNRYDFSKEWTTYSVEHILKRLKTDHLDILLLHRPDPLMEAHEVAEAFDHLKSSGKVIHFGVSNMNIHQMNFLQSHLDMPLIVNQIEIGLHKLDWIEDGVLMNNDRAQQTNFTAGTLEYCMANDVQIQSWASLSQGLFSGRDISQESDNVKNTARLVKTLSDKYSTSAEAIILAWIMRHPAHIQPVIGTMNPERIQACAQAMDITLSREDWYALFESAHGDCVP